LVPFFDAAVARAERRLQRIADVEIPVVLDEISRRQHSPMQVRRAARIGTRRVHSRKVVGRDEGL
jgi:hypothetical protein